MGPLLNTSRGGGTMRNLRHTILTMALAVAVGVLGCGGDSTTPTPPPAPPPAPPPPPPPPPPPAPVALVTLSPATGEITVRAATTLTATLRDAGGNVLAGRTVTWSSSDTRIATVSNGVVTGVAAGGPVTITATSEGVSGTATRQVQAFNLTAIVEAIRTERGLPAMTAAVVTRDGILAIGVSGNRRITGGPAVTLADKWHIGSNLKAITSMLAAIAVQENKISWTTTVTQAFPELAGQIRPEFQSTTLRDLLSMRTGIIGNVNPYQGVGALAQRNWAAGWALSQAPAAPPGSYYYSNLAYVIAGAMVERALGGVYEDLIASKIGTPLGATGIGWGPQALAGASDQPVAHSWQGGGWTPCEACDNPPGLSAAGRSHMPMPSWARIVVEFLRADAGTSPLLTQGNTQPLFTGLTPVGAGSDQYALGWAMTSRTWDGRVATHSGTNNANHSVAWLGLNGGVGLLAATNAGGPGGNSGAALDALILRLLQWYQTGQ